MPVVITGSNTPTAGGVTYGDGTTYATTSAGTSGQLLQSNGAAAPSWVAAPSSAMTLISTQTASSSASLSWTGLSGYNNYMLIFNGLAPTATRSLYVQVGTDGPSYITSYTSNEAVLSGNGAVSNSYQSGGSSIAPAGWTVGIRSTSAASGAIGIYNMTNSVLTNAEGTVVYIDGTSNLITTSLVSGQVGSSTTAKTAIRILYSSGNIVSGTASLYGITS